MHNRSLLPPSPVCGGRSEAQGLCITSKCSPRKLESPSPLLFQGYFIRSGRGMPKSASNAPKEEPGTAFCSLISVLLILKLQCSCCFLHACPKDGHIRCGGKHLQFDEV